MSAMSNRRRPVCHLCPQGDVEYVCQTAEFLVWECPGGRGHSEPRSINVRRESKTAVPRDGVMADAGLFDYLPECLVAGEAWVEHGVVEYRFGQRHPAEYQELVGKYGHRTMPGNKVSSVSNLIARALEFLERDGLLVHCTGPATGCFEGNGTVAYWVLSPKPEHNTMITWEDFATSEGRDPFVWDLIATQGDAVEELPRVA